MDAANLSTKPSLLNKIVADFPELRFLSDEVFRWCPDEQVIYYAATTLGKRTGRADLLHEVGHALLDHRTYSHDIRLLQMEAEAWEKAKELATAYGEPLSPAYIDDSLETYREWLRARAACPECAQAGIQKTKSTYQCINCRCSWRVNSAKFCALRRYRLTR